ncbi:hypothetical protein M569_07153, partial [Genlisea aurea]
KKATTPNGKQKKEELEREVAELRKVLAEEEKIHVFLKGFVHCRDEKPKNDRNIDDDGDDSGLFVPTFLPQKMKEILTELAMVESEITRLEFQIKHLRVEVKSRQRRDDKRPESFEPKTMHFINRAIRGDCSIRDIISAENEDGFPGHHKVVGGGSFRREREFLTRSTTISKPPSPVRDGRHSTSRRDSNIDSSSEFSPWGRISCPNSPQETIQRYTPNKLSESIMKCLIFIFLRLLRRSRVMESEKSSAPATRNTVLSLFQLRAETTNSTSKTSSSQQDPYGIFDSEGSVLRDIGPYKNLVRFSSSSLDLKCIQKSSSVPLFQKLRMLMEALEKVELKSLSDQQKLPFWINIYNACIMQEYLQHGVPSVCNQESMQATMKKATVNVAGETMNAAEIEHILRKSRDPVTKEQSRDEINNRPNPNIAFALCCGTRSSPAVRIYTSEGITAELERSKLEYLQAAIVVTRERRIGLPDLLCRSTATDLASGEESSVDGLAQQLPASGSLRKSIVECVKGGRTSNIVEKIPYDFEFQYLLSM